MKDNLILIGMPAAGKSTIGVVLAKLLGYDFVDSDLVIQRKTGKMLKEIIAEKGNDGFLKVEEEINASLEVSKSVVATGGSVVYGEKAMEHLKEIGRVIYLQVDFDVVSQRLRNIRQRGVVLGDGQTLEDLFNERVPLYEKYADMIIPEGNGTTEDVVRSICGELGVEYST